MVKASVPGFGGVVTGNGARRGPSPLLLGAGGVVILALLGGGFYLFGYGPLVHKQTLSKTIQQHLTSAQAIAQAETQVKNANTSAEKQTAYTALGDAYHSDGQVSQSTSAYQSALVYTPDDIPLLERLSGTYEDEGDNVNAVKTLQKLITALNTSDIADKDFLLSRYQAELHYYQGRQ